MRRRELNHDQQGNRQRLRGIGLVLALVGGVFLAVGLVDFFGAMSGSGGPQKFWCVFVGLPLLSFGLFLLKLSYVGVLARHLAGETAPVAADVVEYVAKETESAVQSTARAIGRGLRDDGPPTTVPCGHCGNHNEWGAKFCDQCGKPIAAPPICVSCKTENEPDAKFCKACGKPIASAT
ncbi:MAG: zinc ribbon domain-containing protein [Planctomycetota bacterium]